MIILTKKKQDKIIEEFIALDNILDDYIEAKVKSLDHIAEIVSITTGIKGLLAMRDNAEIKMYRAMKRYRGQNND